MARVKTQTELLKRRREESIRDYQNQFDAYCTQKAIEDEKKITSNWQFYKRKGTLNQIPSPEKKEFSTHHQTYTQLSKLVNSEKLEARLSQGLTQSATDLRNPASDSHGVYVNDPSSKTRTELFAKRGRCDRK